METDYHPTTRRRGERAEGPAGRSVARWFAFGLFGVVALVGLVAFFQGEPAGLAMTGAGTLYLLGVAVEALLGMSRRRRRRDRSGEW